MNNYTWQLSFCLFIALYVPSSICIVNELSSIPYFASKYIVGVVRKNRKG